MAACGLLASAAACSVPLHDSTAIEVAKDAALSGQRAINKGLNLVPWYDPEYQRITEEVVQKRARND